MYSLVVLRCSNHKLMTPMRSNGMILMVTRGCLFFFAAVFLAHAQRAPAVSGCNGAPQTHQVTIDVNQDGKLFYREGDNDATTVHVCPGDDVRWTGVQDDDALTLSFSKPGNDEP